MMTSPPLLLHVAHHAATADVDHLAMFRKLESSHGWRRGEDRVLKLEKKSDPKKYSAMENKANGKAKRVSCSIVYSWYLEAACVWCSEKEKKGRGPRGPKFYTCLRGSISLTAADGETRQLEQ